MKSKRIKIVASTFLKFADALPEFFKDAMSVSDETALDITEDILNMALRGVEQKRSKHYGNKES